MQIVLWVLSVAILIPSTLPFYFSWIIASVVLIVVAAARMTNCSYSVRGVFSGGSPETKESLDDETPRQIESESS
jgi:energy-coupling factor transporter transmembrane protein EcfT